MTENRISKKQFQARQGDVFVERIDEAIPKTHKAVKAPKGQQVVLARGSSGDHFHGFLTTAAVKHFKDPKPKDESAALVSYLKVERAAELKLFDATGQAHGVNAERHAAVKLAKGNYRVAIMREYSPKAIRPVGD